MSCPLRRDAFVDDAPAYDLRRNLMCQIQVHPKLEACNRRRLVDGRPCERIVPKGASRSPNPNRVSVVMGEDVAEPEAADATIAASIPRQLFPGPDEIVPSPTL